MADDLVTELSYLAKNLEQAADPCAAREARLLRRAIQALTPIIPKYERYETELNAHVEGAPV